jgi:hypothetical protein
MWGNAMATTEQELRDILTKLTKTEQRILDSLNERGRFAAIIGCGHRKGGGRIRPYGHRDWDAASSLVSKGLASRIGVYPGSNTESGWTERWSELVIGKVGG